MNLIILGPPGAGKGTQSEKISSHYRIPKIVVGDLLRDVVSTGTSELSSEIRSYMEKGLLVPDPVINSLVLTRIKSSDCLSGYILDGFPRNVSQADHLEGDLSCSGSKIDKVFFIKVSDSELLRRIQSRRQCPTCRIVFSVTFDTSLKDALCSSCGGKLEKRQDDDVDIFQKRLSVYWSETSSVVDYYKKRGLLVEIDGVQSVSEVFRNILSHFSPVGREL